MKKIIESVEEGEESSREYKAMTPGQEDADNIPYKDEDIIVNDDIKAMIEMVSKRIMCVRESIYRYGTKWRTIQEFLVIYGNNGINRLVEHCMWLDSRNSNKSTLRKIVNETLTDNE